MKHKLRWLLILAILAGFAVWLEPTRVPWGWLRGEAFYEGRPISWWERELLNWEMHDVGFPAAREQGIDFRALVFFNRRQQARCGWLHDWFGNANTDKDIAQVELWGPRLLHGHPNSEPILLALTESADSNIRQMATYGLHMIETTREEQGK